ncbi:hypothetical protein [Streptomyces sp. NPDC046887]|uniref:hypothetical protein n=1 Tax=Streptomyces sp. NPDC046887 TaxID=3155472 RepID=UPI003406E318
MDKSFYTSWIVEEIREEGRQQGLREGFQEALLLLVLEGRGIDVPEEARERITTCRDLGLLKTWIQRAITADSADDIFTEEATDGEPSAREDQH